MLPRIVITDARAGARAFHVVDGAGAVVAQGEAFDSPEGLIAALRAVQDAAGAAISELEIDIELAEIDEVRANRNGETIGVGCDEPSDAELWLWTEIPTL